MILNYCIRNGFLLYGKHMSNESWCHFNSISFWILFFLFAYRGRASPCFRLVLCIFDKMNLNHLRIFSNLITTTACHGKEVGNIHNTQKYSRHEFITTPDEFYVQKTEKKKTKSTSSASVIGHAFCVSPLQHILSRWWCSDVSPAFARARATQYIIYIVLLFVRTEFLISTNAFVTRATTSSSSNNNNIKSVRECWNEFEMYCTQKRLSYHRGCENTAKKYAHRARWFWRHFLFIWSMHNANVVADLAVADAPPKFLYASALIVLVIRTVVCHSICWRYEIVFCVCVWSVSRK